MVDSHRSPRAPIAGACSQAVPRSSAGRQATSQSRACLAARCARLTAARLARQTVALLSLAGLALVAMSAGCAHDGALAVAGVDTLSTPLPASLGHGEARLFFYRITSAKTGERLGISRTFAIEPERQVRSVVQLEGLDPGREILLHVMWVNPDGLEVFTKEAHITREDWFEPARRDTLAKEHVQVDPIAGFLELESRYGVDPIRIEEEAHKDEESRRFKAGTWSVKVYLFRRLFLESSFELAPPA